MTAFTYLCCDTQFDRTVAAISAKVYRMFGTVRDKPVTRHDTSRERSQNNPEVGQHAQSINDRCYAAFPLKPIRRRKKGDTPVGMIMGQNGEDFGPVEDDDVGLGDSFSQTHNMMPIRPGVVVVQNPILADF